MSTSVETDPFVRVIARIDPRSRLLGARPLAGGVSARVTALDVEKADGHTQTVIVRRHGPRDLARNPHIARDEYRLLQFLQASGVPAPAPLLADDSGTIFDTPFIVVSYLDGKPEFAPANLGALIEQIAAQLARLHTIGGTNAQLSFMPRQEAIFADWLRRRPPVTDEAMSEGRIRDTLEAVWPLQQRNRTVLLHGDYWPGNLLWQDGRLTGIIDWEDAAIGDPLADLGNTRLEMLWAYGIDAMRQFTRDYLAQTAIDTANLPYWDLRAALLPCGRLSEWASGDAATEAKMREGHRAFVAQAVEALQKQEDIRGDKGK